MTRALKWIVLVAATLVVVGVFLQVYFIAAYSFGAGEDALDAHTGLGNVVHALEAVTFLAGLGAFWRRWWDVGLSFALIAVGTIQIGLSEADDWAGGLHGLLAMFVLVLATIIAHRTVRALGMGRHHPQTD